MNARMSELGKAGGISGALRGPHKPDSPKLPKPATAACDDPRGQLYIDRTPWGPMRDTVMTRTCCLSLLALLFLPGALALTRAQEPIAPPATVDLPAPRLVAPAQPMTLGEFAACFQATPGWHEALLVNPVTGCPVLVQFTLPCGCPRVRVHRREIAFDYGRHAVVRIKFRIIT